MTIKTFTSHDNIAFTLTRENCYGMKPLQINKSLGFSNNEVVVLEENLTVVSLRAVAWINSLAQISLPDLPVEDSREQKAQKMLNLQWTSPRKRMDLFLLNNQENNLLASFSMLNPSMYPYTQYEMMEALESVNDKFLIANNFDLGVQIVDDGFGFLDDDDKITIYASVEKKVTVLYKFQNIIINPNQNTPPTNINLSSTSIDENVASNTVVGTFSATGSSSNTFTYSLVSGEGSTDNGEFTIDGNSIKINDSPDYETKSSYNIRVQVVDGNNLSYQKQFTITVNNLVENIATPIINLFGSNSGLVNSGSRTDLAVTEDNVTIDDNGIAFSDSSITIENSLTGIDLNDDFIFEFELTTNASEGTFTIVDFRQSTQFSTPRIAIGTNWDTFELELRVLINNEIKLFLPISTGVLLNCSYQRIQGMNSLTVNETVTDDYFDDNQSWSTPIITLGRSISGTSPLMNSVLNHIKLTIF